MIKVRLNGDTYLGIAFSHHKLQRGNPRDPDRYTFCNLWQMNEIDGMPMASLAEGAAACSRQDNFRKETGRKIALTRAIQKLRLSKLERHKIWQAYLNRDRDS